MRIFAKNLKKERESNGLTQRELADLLGIPYKTYQGYEALGKAGRTPDIEMIVKIAKILKTTTDELLGMD